MTVMMLMTADSKVMGTFTIKGWLHWLGWASRRNKTPVAAAPTQCRTKLRLSPGLASSVAPIGNLGGVDNRTFLSDIP